MTHAELSKIQITMTPVASSQIAEIGHDAEHQILAIRFKSETQPLYYYENFDAAKFAEFSAAESIGSYFYKRIKPWPDMHPYTRMQPSPIVAQPEEGEKANVE